MANSKNTDLPLIEDIRLLGKILGDIVREQEGVAVFELVERILSYVQPRVSQPSGNILRSTGFPSLALLFSSSVCNSSNLRKNSK